MNLFTEIILWCTFHTVFENPLVGTGQVKERYIQWFRWLCNEKTFLDHGNVWQIVTWVPYKGFPWLSFMHSFILSLSACVCASLPISNPYMQLYMHACACGGSRYIENIAEAYKNKYHSFLIRPNHALTDHTQTHTHTNKHTLAVRSRHTYTST